MHEYDQIAAWYTRTRSASVGVPDLAALARTLPPGASVLDIGCGDGVPLSRFLVDDGFAVTGLDSSAEMVRRFRARLPGVPVWHGWADASDFEAGSFDAVVAWGVLFHLSVEEQGALVRKVSAWIRPGGRFLFTSGDVEGEREGTMDGVAFRYVSLDRDGYRRLLARSGLRLTTDYADAYDNHVYIAEAGPDVAREHGPRPPRP